MSQTDRHVRETRHGASELKFLVDNGLGGRIAEWARAHLPPDPHGTGAFGDQYRITSLYFDTAGHDVLHARGSFGRCKYRVRRYGRSEFAFLERKLRKPGLLHKRRTLTPLDDIDRLSALEPEQPWPGEWFHRRLIVRRLRPVCQLSYVRLARVMHAHDAVMRLTLDDQVRVREIAHCRFSGDPDIPVLDQRMVLELKYRGDLPALFKRVIETFSLTLASGSKYRLGMAALGQKATTRS